MKAVTMKFDPIGVASARIGARVLTHWIRKPNLAADTGQGECLWNVSI
jgi:hypothetical protein